MTKRTHASSNATVYQFPIALCYAVTCHKFQGQEVPKPDKVAMQMEKVFQPAMAYVMLSIVPSLEQLFIINSLPTKMIKANEHALQELRRMERIALNMNLPNRRVQIFCL